MTTETTTPTPVMAIFCGAEHWFTGALCSRIDCDGIHQSDGGDAWTEPDDENGTR